MISPLSNPVTCPLVALGDTNTNNQIRGLQTSMWKSRSKLPRKEKIKQTPIDIYSHKLRQKKFVQFKPHRWSVSYHQSVNTCSEDSSEFFIEDYRLVQDLQMDDLVIGAVLVSIYPPKKKQMSSQMATQKNFHFHYRLRLQWKRRFWKIILWPVTYDGRCNPPCIPNLCSPFIALTYWWPI